MEARKLSTSQAQPFHLSLCIFHPSIDPAEISRNLGLTADESFRAGEPRESATMVHRESCWVGTLAPPPRIRDFAQRIAGINSPGSSRAARALRKSQAAAEARMGARRVIQFAAATRLNQALALASAFLSRKHAAFLNRIRSEGGRITLFVTLAAETVGRFSLPPEVGRALGELGITVEFEFTGD